MGTWPSEPQCSARHQKQKRDKQAFRSLFIKCRRSVHHLQYQFDNDEIAAKYGKGIPERAIKDRTRDGMINLRHDYLRHRCSSIVSRLSESNIRRKLRIFIRL